MYQIGENVMKMKELIKEFHIMHSINPKAVDSNMVAVDGLGRKWTVEGIHPSHTTPKEIVVIIAEIP